MIFLQPTSLVQKSLLCLLIAFTSLALFQSSDAQRLPFRTFSVDDGLLQSTAYCVHQDSKGYLWIGTQDGISRFDGYSFTNYTTEHGLINNRVLAVAESQGGTLWFGTANGVSRFSDGVFTSPDSSRGFPEGIVYSLLADNDDSIWMGTQKGLMLVVRDSVAWKAPDESPMSTEVFFVYKDKSGVLWLGSNEGAISFNRAGVRAYGRESGLPGKSVKCFAEDHAGRLFVGTEGGGIYRKEGEKFVVVGRTSVERSAEVYSLCVDRAGELWAGTFGSGVLRYADDVSSVYSTVNGLPSKVVRSIIQDREENMWFGTYDGIARLGMGDIQSYTAEVGLPHNTVMAVAQGTDGSMWLGTYGGGACRLSNGAFSTFDTASGLPHNTVRAILCDRQGTVWFATHKGLARLSGRAFKVFTRRNGLSSDVILALHEDRLGRLWVGTFDGGACVFEDGLVTVFDIHRGLLSNRVRSIAEDREAVWLGTDEGLTRFDGKGFTHFTTKDGLPNNTIRSLTVRSDGSLWISTDGGGIGVYRGGSFVNYSTKDGLANNVCFFALEDDNGHMWIGTNKGLSRFDGSTFRTYSTKDGLVANEMNSGAAMKDRSGMLWFGSNRGLIKINPTNLSFSHLNPSPYVTRVRVFDRDVPLKSGLKLSHMQNVLEFDFVAIHLSAPHAVEYRYKLEGIDEEWRTTFQRSVPYSSLPPGEYRFLVTARILDGDWTLQPATFSFTILPPFWGTWSFRVLAMGSALLVVGVVIRRRVQAVRNERERQQEFSRRLIASQEAERKRIAAGLHDSLGQNLLVLKTTLQQCQEGCDLEEQLRAELDGLAELVQQSLNEVREISFDLHPHVLDRLGLRKALETMVEKITHGFPVSISTDFSSLPARLETQLEIGIYRIVQEALSNVVKHSDARNALVRMRATKDGLQLEIADDGKGFDAGEYLTRPPEKWSLGLLNISERVRLLGGTYALSSKPGAGTALTAYFPFKQCLNVPRLR